MLPPVILPLRLISPFATTLIDPVCVGMHLLLGCKCLSSLYDDVCVYVCCCVGGSGGPRDGSGDSPEGGVRSPACVWIWDLQQCAARWGCGQGKQPGWQPGQQPRGNQPVDLHYVCHCVIGERVKQVRRYQGWANFSWWDSLYGRTTCVIIVVHAP